MQVVRATSPSAGSVEPTPGSQRVADVLASSSSFPAFSEFRKKMVRGISLQALPR